MSRPIGIDLFAGAGGMSLGFEQAGFDVAAAVEIDPVHAAVHKFNFPNGAVLPRSVVGLGGDAIRAAAGIGDSEVEVVFGGPPCQGFSLMGQRAFDDPRNSLVKEFVRIVHELSPRYFVFENVKGLTVGRHREFLEELIEAFDHAGYALALPWKVLNAARYGVPQDRQRLILLGARQGERLPVYPAPSHFLPGEAHKDLLAAPTCHDALADLPDADCYPILLKTDEVKAREWGEPSPYAKALRPSRPKDWVLGHPRAWDASCLTSSMRTEHSEISRRRFAATPPGEVEPVSRFFRLSATGLCNTLRAGTDSARGAFTSPRPIHYLIPRCVTVREMARLHGYPDWFRFHVTKWHGARQIGNSVPPPLASAIASQIVAALGVKPERPQAAIPLGDPRLLWMDMSQASAHWGVPPPIGKRDRKSGARKRKQSQIEMWNLIEGAYA